MDRSVTPGTKQRSIAELLTGSPEGIPSFYCPYAARRSPGIDEMRSQVQTFVENLGFVPADDAEKISEFSSAFFAWAFPDAPDDLNVALSVLTMVSYYLDDFICVPGADAGEAAVTLHRIMLLGEGAAFAPGTDLPGSGSPVVDAGAVAYRSMAALVRDLLPPQESRLLLLHLRAWLASLPSELGYHNSSTPHTIDEYFTIRFFDAAAACTAGIFEIWQEATVPADITYAPHVQAAIQAAVFMLMVTNDIITYPKENEPGDSGHNIITALRSIYGFDEDEAITEATAIRDDALELFVSLHEKISRVEPRAATLLDDCGTMMAGIIAWHAHGKRYEGSLSQLDEIHLSPTRRSARPRLVDLRRLGISCWWYALADQT